MNIDGIHYQFMSSHYDCKEIVVDVETALAVW